MQRSRISILIPTWNGARALSSVLDAIERQSRRPDEIVAVDSGSTDGTPALLAARGVRVHAIPAGEFNHGETRNAGVRITDGNLIVLLVQDAIPVDTHWLDALSPLSTLARGYAVARGVEGETLASTRDFAPGMAFSLMLRDGIVRATADAVERGARRVEKR